MSIKRGRSLVDVVSAIDDEPSGSSATLEKSSQPASAAQDEAAPMIVPVNILVTPQDRKRLRQLSLDTGLSVQKLGHEAWNRLLESRGLPPLQAVAANVPSGRLRRRSS